MHVLLTNDDGLRAPGLQALMEGLRDEVTTLSVVAPDRNQSGCSHSLTLTRPIDVHRVGDGVFAVEGSTVDAVHLALTGLLPSMPDVVISGVNHGSNLGCDVIYSGTVAGAREACLMGVPGLALSLMSPSGHLQTPVDVVRAWLQGGWLQERLQAQVPFCLNVNVPDLPTSELNGFRVTRLGRRHPGDAPMRVDHPRLTDAFWIGPAGAPHEGLCDATDFLAVQERHVSVTPLQWDQTHHAALEVWKEHVQ